MTRVLVSHWKTLLVGILAVSLIAGLGIGIPSANAASDNHQEPPGVIGTVSIEVSPPEPNMGDDICITVSGDFSATNYALIWHHHLVLNRMIFIWGTMIQTAPIGCQVITPWEFTEDIGKLRAGDYVVKVFLNWHGVASTQFDVSPFCVTTDEPAYKIGERVSISITNVGYRPIIDSLTLSIYDEEGNVLDSVVFFLGWDPLMLGESIPYDMENVPPGIYTAVVRGSGFQRSAEFTIVELVDIGDIWTNPSVYVGKYVLIDGEYMGWCGDCEYAAPVTYSDWMLQDETGCIYVSAWSEAQPNLSACEEEDLGTSLEMIALVTTTLDDDYPWNDGVPSQPYVESQTVWGVQTTTDKSEYELGEHVVITMTSISSDTLTGGGVCMSIYDSEGNLVAGGICMTLAFEWEPGEGIVWPIPWDQIDMQGEPVPAGTYIVAGQADHYVDATLIYIS